MKFILSKVLLFLLFPITWVFVLLVLALISKKTKHKKRYLIATILVFYLFSVPIILDTYARLWDYPPAQLNPKAKYSCVIVLGGFSSVDRNNRGYFNAASDRIIQGVKLYTSGKASHILISSGNGNLLPGKFREAGWVYGQLKQLNIPDSVILIENQSRNTIENALYTKKLLAEKHIASPYLLVTSAFHMRRSMLIFEKAGIKVIPYPCDYIAGVRKLNIAAFLPDASVFDAWEYYTKELVGIVVARYSKF